MYINKVILSGYVGNVPDIRYVDKEQVVARLSLATNETHKNKQGERVVTTHWHKIVLWRSLAKLAEEYIKKGTELYVEGKITYNTWEDKSGGKHYTAEIIGEKIMLGRKPEKKDTEEATEDNLLKFTNNIEDADNLPF